jgi:hypothetical protein
MDFSKKPVIFFTTASLILLIAYISIFINKTKIFPTSEAFCWVSSTIIALFIASSLYESERVYGNGNMIYTIIIYLLLIGCALCSLGLVWNASILPEIKLKL